MPDSRDLLDSRWDGDKTSADRPFPVSDAAAVAKLELIRQLADGLATGADVGAIVTALGETLAVSGPLTDAQLAARGLATQATLAAVLGKLSGDPATQSTLAAVLAKLSGDPATDSTLVAIKNALQAQVDLSSTLWTDDSQAFYVRREVVNQAAGTVTVSFTTPAGDAATPGAGLRPAANEESLSSIQTIYNANTTNSGGGYTAGDVIAHQAVLNENATPPVIVATTWLNLTSGAVISTPTAGHLTLASKDVTISSSALPAGAATAANQATISTATGAPADAAWSGSGSGGIIGVLKAIWAKLGSVVLGAGSAVIGKVGLQVAGADVARANAVPVNAVGFDSLGNPLPADFDSCAWTPGYDASGNMITMTVVASTGTYIATDTYVNGVCTLFGAWVKQ